MLFDNPEFRDWFHATYRTQSDPHSDLHIGDCQGCGSTSVPVLIEHCLTCVAGDFGMSLGEKRIADALRAFVGILVNDPPEVAQRVVSQIMFALAEATRGVSAEGADDEPADDEPDA